MIIVFSFDDCLYIIFILKRKAKGASPLVPSCAVYCSQIRVQTPGRLL
jgi:hypothetical protein